MGFPAKKVTGQKEVKFSVGKKWSGSKLPFSLESLFSVCGDLWGRKGSWEYPFIPERCTGYCKIQGQDTGVKSSGELCFNTLRKAKAVQPCPALCDPMDWGGILQAAVLKWVAFPSSRGSLPTQGLNPGLPRHRQILYHLGQQGSPRILEWVAYPFCKDLPNPGIKLESLALQTDSLPVELPGRTSEQRRWGLKIELEILCNCLGVSWTYTPPAFREVTVAVSNGSQCIRTMFHETANKHLNTFLSLNDFKV